MQNLFSAQIRADMLSRLEPLLCPMWLETLTLGHPQSLIMDLFFSVYRIYLYVFYKEFQCSHV